MAHGPLDGVKVLEYCSFIAGPHCAKMLADLGTEVIKIEKPEGDIARKHGPYLHDEVNPETSGIFLYENTNKKGITLKEDLRAFMLLYRFMKSGQILPIPNFALIPLKGLRAKRLSFAAFLPEGNKSGGRVYLTDGKVNRAQWPCYIL